MLRRAGPLLWWRVTSTVKAARSEARTPCGLTAAGLHRLDSGTHRAADGGTDQPNFHRPGGQTGSSGFRDTALDLSSELVTHPVTR